MPLTYVSYENLGIRAPWESIYLSQRHWALTRSAAGLPAPSFSVAGKPEMKYLGVKPWFLTAPQVVNKFFLFRRCIWQGTESEFSGNAAFLTLFQRELQVLPGQQKK